MTLARDQKRNLSPRRPSFHVKNRILLPNEARFTGFGYTSVSIGATNGAFGYTSPLKNTPGDHVALTLHGRPVTQTGNQRIMERYGFSETEKGVNLRGRKHETLWGKMRKSSAIILSTVSFVISIVALCIAAYRSPELGFDYLGLLVGIQAVLVTALIGWNIYAVLDLRSIKSELTDTKEHALFNAEKNNALTAHAAGDVFYSLLVGAVPFSFEYHYLYYRLSECLHLSHIRNMDTCNSVVQSIFESIAAPERIRLTDLNRAELIALVARFEHKEEIQEYGRLVQLVALAGRQYSRE